MTEGRVDRMARRLASSERLGPSVRTVARPAAGEPMLDGVARVLASSVTRRRAVVLISGAVVAGSTLRPGRASADARVCSGDKPKKCQGAGGQSVCVPADWPCCSNPLCGGACRPGQVCRPGDGDPNAHCEDTAAICGKGANIDRPVFCEQKGRQTGSVTCGQAESIDGQALSWCCGPGTNYRCGTTPGVVECICLTKCGSQCCAKNEYCEPGPLGIERFGTCKKKCPNPGDRHCSGNFSGTCCAPERDCDGDGQCKCRSGQVCGPNCCKAGSVCIGNGRCGKPSEVPKTSPLPEWMNFWGDLAGETAASRGGAAKHVSVGASAAASGPVGAALLALAAVEAQGAAAGIALTDGHVDRAYRRTVVAAKPAPAKLKPGPGLDVRAASALNALIAAEAGAFALIAATATSLARARGAAEKRDALLMRRQVRAAATFAGQAAKALRRAAPLRAKAATALAATRTAEVTATAADVIAFQATVRTAGVPADLASALKRLGVGGGDLTRARAALLTASTGGPVLIAPLADTGGTKLMQALAARLARFAKDARRTPIRTYRGGPLRIKGTAARAPSHLRR